MTVLAVFVRDRVHDAEEFKVYAQKSAAARGDHKMKGLAYYGAVETLEGAKVDGVVIVEFADMAAAHAWYDSPAYQEAKIHRLNAADYRVFFVEGL